VGSVTTVFLWFYGESSWKAFDEIYPPALPLPHDVFCVVL
jgi:hypothetical protein